MENSKNNKKLVKNILLISLSTFVPKVLSFLMIPIYTIYLTTKDYGISDLILTTSSLLLPIFTLAISNAVIRFTIEDKDNKKPYFVAIYVYIIGSIVLFVALGMISFLFKINLLYLSFIFILFAVSGIYQINVAYLRGMEKISFLSVCSVVSSFITIIANIIFITVFRGGLYGFILSSIIGYLVVDIMAFIKIHKYHIFRTKFSIRKETALVKTMLAYSVPLIFSGLAWWINSVSDRYFVSFMIGVGANGIYSVAYKIPTILQMVQDVFTPAWNLSVFDVYKKKDGIKYINKIYDFYNFLMVFACSFLIFLSKPLARFLFSKEFYNAWKFVPVLLISVVFISMGACLGPLLTAYKKSVIVAKGSILTAVCNIILNFILISFIGIQGAAISTTISFVISWLYSVIQVKKICLFQFNWKKHLAMYVLLLVETFIVLNISEFWLSGIVVIIIGLINISNLKMLIIKLRYVILNKISKKNIKENSNE